MSHVRLGQLSRARSWSRAGSGQSRGPPGVLPALRATKQARSCPTPTMPFPPLPPSLPFPCSSSLTPPLPPTLPPRAPTRGLAVLGKVHSSKGAASQHMRQLQLLESHRAPAGALPGQRRRVSVGRPPGEAALGVAAAEGGGRQGRAAVGAAAPAAHGAVMRGSGGGRGGARGRPARPAGRVGGRLASAACLQVLAPPALLAARRLARGQAVGSDAAAPPPAPHHQEAGQPSREGCGAGGDCGRRQSGAWQDIAAGWR